MKVKMVMNTVEGSANGQVRTTNQIWEGEIEIPAGVFVTKISVLGEGEWHPICDVPFSLSEGYWAWIGASDDSMFGSLAEVEKVGGHAFNQDGGLIEP
jgi:hypothetical protein